VPASLEPKYFNAPSSLALLFIFGLVYLYAFAHLFGVSLTNITAFFYLVMAAWSGVIFWQHPVRLKDVNWVDISFFLFVLWVLSSLVIGDDEGLRQQASFFFYMSVVPYVCGRLCQDTDYYLIFRWSVFISGGLVLLALVDYLLFPLVVRHQRWPFFGVPHGTLLVGMIASFGFIALISCFLDKECKLFRRYTDIITVILTVGSIAFMSWIMARGFYLASLVAAVIIILLGGNSSKRRRFFLLSVLLVSTSVFLGVFQTNDFLKQVLEVPPTVGSPRFGSPRVGSPRVGSPRVGSHAILGSNSCRPIEENVDSIAIRWLLYREAIAITEKYPYTGVGAASFGRYSCAGPGSYPHSTILQVFSELGVTGGLLYLLLGGVGMYVFLLYAIRKKTASSLWLLGMYISAALTDQLYGSYFMDVHGSLFLGLGASLLAANRDISDV